MSTSLSFNGTTSYQGGPYLELLGTSGSHPLQHWKVTGTGVPVSTNGTNSNNNFKVYDRSCKGYVFGPLNQSSDISSTTTSNCTLSLETKQSNLGLIHPLLVVQVGLKKGKVQGNENQLTQKKSNTGQTTTGTPNRFITSTNTKSMARVGNHNNGNSNNNSNMVSNFTAAIASSSFSLELVISDNTGNVSGSGSGSRRRLGFTTSIRQASVSPMSARFPLPLMNLVQQQSQNQNSTSSDTDWFNLCFDVPTLSELAWGKFQTKNSTCSESFWKSTETVSISISQQFSLRKIFTVNLNQNFNVNSNFPMPMTNNSSSQYLNPYVPQPLNFPTSMIESGMVRTGFVCNQGYMNSNNIISQKNVNKNVSNVNIIIHVLEDNSNTNSQSQLQQKTNNFDVRGNQNLQIQGERIVSTSSAPSQNSNHNQKQNFNTRPKTASLSTVPQSQNQQKNVKVNTREVLNSKKQPVSSLIDRPRTAPSMEISESSTRSTTYRSRLSNRNSNSKQWAQAQGANPWSNNNGPGDINNSSGLRQPSKVIGRKLTSVSEIESPRSNLGNQQQNNLIDQQQDSEFKRIVVTDHSTSTGASQITNNNTDTTSLISPESISMSEKMNQIINEYSNNMNYNNSLSVQHGHQSNSNYSPLVSNLACESLKSQSENNNRSQIESESDQQQQQLQDSVEDNQHLDLDESIKRAQFKNLNESRNKIEDVGIADSYDNPHRYQNHLNLVDNIVNGNSMKKQNSYKSNGMTLSNNLNQIQNQNFHGLNSNKDLNQPGVDIRNTITNEQLHHNQSDSHANLDISQHESKENSIHSESFNFANLPRRDYFSDNQIDEESESFSDDKIQNQIRSPGPEKPNINESERHQDIIIKQPHTYPESNPNRNSNIDDKFNDKNNDDQEDDTEFLMQEYAAKLRHHQERLKLLEEEKTMNLNSMHLNQSVIAQSQNQNNFKQVQDMAMLEEESLINAMTLNQKYNRNTNIDPIIESQSELNESPEIQTQSQSKNQIQNQNSNTSINMSNLNQKDLLKKMQYSLDSVKLNSPDSITNSLTAVPVPRSPMEVEDQEDNNINKISRFTESPNLPRPDLTKKISDSSPGPAKPKLNHINAPNSNPKYSTNNNFSIDMHASYTMPSGTITTATVTELQKPEPKNHNDTESTNSISKESTHQESTHLEVIYDPNLGVYYDPATKKYYRLKS